MKKIRLDLDHLQVESFATTEPEPARGTVAGHASFDLTCLQSCGATCNGSCYDTCHVPCATGVQCNNQSDYGTCQCPTRDGCQRPSTSCEETQTVGEYTCYCLYANTDARACCSGAGCSGMC